MVVSVMLLVVVNTEEILDYSHLMADGELNIFLFRLFFISKNNECLVLSLDGVQVVEGKGGNYKFVQEDDVLLLTRENFHYFILSRATVLVQFYAPLYWPK